MAVLVGKPIDLVFHAWAVPWANTFYFSHEHGASVKARPNDVVRSLIGMRDPTRHLLRVHVCAPHKAKNWNTGISIQAARHTVSRLFLAL